MTPENGSKPEEGIFKMSELTQSRAKARNEMAGESRAAQALFESVSDDGTRWLFVVLPDDGWEITRDGEIVGSGSSERKSVDAGVQQFLSITVAVISPRHLRCRGAPSARLS